MLHARLMYPVCVYVPFTSLAFCKPNTLDEDILPSSSLRGCALFLTTRSALGTDIPLGTTLFPDACCLRYLRVSTESTIKTLYYQTDAQIYNS